MRGILTAILLALTAVALAATHAATYQSPQFLQEYFLPIAAVNAVLLAALLAATVASVGGLIRKLRRGVFGGRLSLRLGLLFTMMAALPALLIYALSVNAIFRSIESWFDAPLGGAFDKGLELGQSLLGRSVNHLEDVAHAIGGELSAREISQFRMDDLRILHQLEEIAIFNQQGRLLAYAGEGVDSLSIRAPSAAGLAALRQGEAHRDFIGEGGGTRIEIMVPVQLLTFGDNLRAVRVAGRLPQSIAEGIDGLRAGRRDYAELSILRRGLRLSFLLTLSFTALATVLAAANLALWLGERFSRPLARLAAATEAVARGDFSRREKASGSDEIAILIRSFNRMTGQLEQAQTAARDNQRELTASNLHLENLLANISAGVLVLDGEGRLVRINESAARILGGKIRRAVGKTLREWPLESASLSPVTAALADAVAMDNMESSGEFEREIRGEAGSALVIRARRLPSAAGGGHIAVVDDITRQVQAEREATWEEAGRRFAHEIKNPLTPIRLAAERLKFKLSDKIPSAESRSLDQAVTIIVNQVDAMAEMVDSFRAYATPKRGLRRFRPVDLNALAEEAALLYQGRGPEVRTTLAPNLPPVAGDAVALRQILHNLLQNAADALGEKADGKIDIMTSRDDNLAALEIRDNGGGVSPDIIGKVFEPYITTKPRGTGLGLAVVKRLAEEHGGAVRVANADGGGARIIINLPIADDGKEAQSSHR